MASAVPRSLPKKKKKKEKRRGKRKKKGDPRIKWAKEDVAETV